MIEVQTVFRTPHESLPVKERKYRQFFRLVTSNVSLWYESHSTANPLGVIPDKRITKVVAGNKFSEEGLRLVCDNPKMEDGQKESFLSKTLNALSLKDFKRKKQ